MIQKYIFLIIAFTGYFINTYSQTFKVTGQTEVYSGSNITYNYNCSGVTYGTNVEWKVENGTFQPSGKKTLSVSYSHTQPVTVKWDEDSFRGSLRFQVRVSGGIYYSDPFDVLIRNLKRVYTIVECDEFDIESDEIYIPIGQKAIYTLRAKSWFEVGYGDPNYEFKSFFWTFPSSSGGSIFISNGKATLICGNNDGEGDKIRISPYDEDRRETGKSTYITIRRFDRTIKDKYISSRKEYDFPNLYLENVFLMKDANVTLNGYNSVHLLPGFTAELGSTVRIYNGTAPKVLTRVTIDEDNIVENEIDIDKYSAKLYQNIPNPASFVASIPLLIPEMRKSAYLQFYNMMGILVMKIPITSIGQNSIDVNTTELTNGVYMYSLIVDDCLIDTKRMVVAN
ncbi:hypothetical protein [Bacteroides sp. HPS0048]|uniref:hypothetical protein n=1 Tax=Bacteroides sp. HPS0048 TaxID=1078089 RepID=UPI003566FE8C